MLKPAVDRRHTGATSETEPEMRKCQRQIHSGIGLNSIAIQYKGRIVYRPGPCHSCHGPKCDRGTTGEYELIADEGDQLKQHRSISISNKEETLIECVVVQVHE